MMAKKEYSKLGAAASDFLQASADRLDDARTLIAAGRSAMGIAMGLYALEIRIKALTCERLDLDRLPRPFEIHDLDDLLLLAGLSRKIKDDALKSTKFNWDQIRSMSEKLNELRYNPKQDRRSSRPKTS